MIIIGIILGVAAIGFLCWILFSLAVYALPFFAALSAGMWAYHSNAGPVGAILVGIVAGAATLVAGQVAFAFVRSTVRPPPSVPTMMRQSSPWSLPSRAEVTSCHGHAVHSLRKDSCRWRRNGGRP